MKGDFKGFNDKGEMFRYWIEHCQKRHNHDKDPDVRQPFSDPTDPPVSPPSTPPVSRSPSPIPVAVPRTPRRNAGITPGSVSPSKVKSSGSARGLKPLPVGAVPTPNRPSEHAEQVGNQDKVGECNVKDVVYYCIKTSRSVVSTVNR